MTECSNHYYLEEFNRGMDAYYGGYQCDNNLQFGWYRFRGAAGTQMPTSCVVRYRCGMNAPGWLNGAHPSVADGIVHATVCFSYYYGCCQWRRSIRVRNCGGFYVYELGPTPHCNLRYCGNGGGKERTIVRRTDGCIMSVRVNFITKNFISLFPCFYSQLLSNAKCHYHDVITR